MDVIDRDSPGEEQQKERPRPDFLEVLEADAEVRDHTQPRQTSEAIRAAVRGRLAQRR